MGHPLLYVTFSVRPSICPSVSRSPYLRNRTSSDHNFWYTCVKWWYLQIYSNYIRHAPYLRNSIAYDHYFWYTYVKLWYLHAFFSFFQNFDWGKRSKNFDGVKGQKMAQSDKKFCRASYLRNHTSYDCHLWYTCVKWWYLKVFLSFFQNFPVLPSSQCLFSNQSEWLEKRADQSLCVKKEALRTTLIPTKTMVRRYIISNA